MALLCPDQQFFDWRITTNHQRARRFFKYDADAQRLRILGQALSQRLEQLRGRLLDPQCLGDFVGRHQDMLQLTELRTCAVSNPEEEITRLFRRLVEPESETVKHRRAMNALQVRTYTTCKFREAGIFDKLEKDVEFQAHYRTSPYHFSFGYQNGGPYKLIQTTSFAYTEPEEGCKHGLVLLGQIEDVRNHHQDRNLNFEVVGAFNPDQQDVRRAVHTAFKENNIPLWSPDRIDLLIDRVKRELR